MVYWASIWHLVQSLFCSYDPLKAFLFGGIFGFDTHLPLFIFFAQWPIQNPLASGGCFKVDAAHPWSVVVWHNCEWTLQFLHSSSAVAGKGNLYVFHTTWCIWKVLRVMSEESFSNTVRLIITQYVLWVWGFGIKGAPSLQGLSKRPWQSIS